MTFRTSQSYFTLMALFDSLFFTLSGWTSRFWSVPLFESRVIFTLVFNRVALMYTCKPSRPYQGEELASQFSQMTLSRQGSSENPEPPPMYQTPTVISQHPPPQTSYIMATTGQPMPPPSGYQPATGHPHPQPPPPPPSQQVMQAPPPPQGYMQPPPPPQQVIWHRL